jgi:hypothetical protein
MPWGDGGGREGGMEGGREGWREGESGSAAMVAGLVRVLGGWWVVGPHFNDLGRS